MPNTIIRRLLEALSFILFAGAFLLGGSDGPAFPWPNVCGLVMAMLCAPVAIAANRLAVRKAEAPLRE